MFGAELFPSDHCLFNRKVIRGELCSEGQFSSAMDGLFRAELFPAMTVSSAMVGPSSSDGGDGMFGVRGPD
jgi:hypothetical protein